jgi:hypothetical protein
MEYASIISSLLLSQVTDIVDDFPQGKDAIIRSINLFGILIKLFSRMLTQTLANSSAKSKRMLEL